MRNWLKRLIAPFAAIVFVAPVMRADQVNFSTTGSFGGTDAIASGGTNLSKTDTVTVGTETATATSTLTFAGVGPLGTPAESFPFAVVDLGTFTLHYTYTSSNGILYASNMFNVNDTFTVTINES